MPIKKKGLGKSKNLAQGNTSIHGEFFGPFTSSLPLIDGENQAEYESFREGCLRAIKPKDAVEIVWLQDFIDYFWEAQRLKRMKVTLIQVSKREAIERLIRIFGNEKNAKMAVPLSKEWSRREVTAVSYVNDLLGQHGLDEASVMAKAVESCLPTLERFDKLITTYNYRRDAALRELEKRRDLLAKRARDFGEAMIAEIESQDLDEGISPLPPSFN